MMSIGFVYSLSNSKAIRAKTNLRMQFQKDAKRPNRTRVHGFLVSTSHHNTLGKLSRMESYGSLHYISQPINSFCWHVIRSLIREPGRVYKYLNLVSLAHTKGCLMTDVLAVSKPKSNRKPVRKTCHLLHSPTTRFCQRFLSDIANSFRSWALGKKKRRPAAWAFFCFISSSFAPPHWCRFS